MAKAAVAALIAVYLLALVQSSRCQLCSQCECLPEPMKRPICARQDNTGKYRGFRSLCELDCSNRCRTNKFVFVADMRCGKYLAKLSSTASPSTSTEAAVGALQGPATGWVDKTIAEAGSSSSIFGSLWHAMLNAARGK